MRRTTSPASKNPITLYSYSDPGQAAPPSNMVGPVPRPVEVAASVGSARALTNRIFACTPPKYLFSSPKDQMLPRQLQPGSQREVGYNFVTGRLTQAMTLK